MNKPFFVAFIVLGICLGIVSAPTSLDSRTKKYHPFHRSLVATVTTDNLIVCGYPISYEVEFYDTEGILIKKIFKEYDLVQISQEVLEEAQKQRIPLNPTPITLKKDRLYSLEEDEDGFQVVKRYKVTWKY